MVKLDEAIKGAVCDTLEDISEKLHSLYDDILAELHVKFDVPPDMPTEEQTGYMKGIEYSQDVNRKFMDKMCAMFRKKFLEKEPSENEPLRKGDGN